MSNAVKNEYRPDRVSPPGDTLREVLEERGLSQAELALRAGRPTKTISEIVHGKAAITPETALQFELVLGIPAEFWNAREQHYREYRARLAEARSLKRDIDWAKKFPTRDMKKLGWIRDEPDPACMVRELLQFYGVASRQQWYSLASMQEASFSRPASFRSDFCALSAWLRQGVRQATEVPCAPFRKDVFRESLKRVRELTTQPPKIFCRELKETCARAGVAVAFVPELPKSRASGATRWLSPRKALIQLSLRYKTDDQLWFTFFHEAGHILLHGKKPTFIENDEGCGTQEDEVSRFCADALIPPDNYAQCHSLNSDPCIFS